MNFRFIEAEDEARSNHGKFALFKFGASDWRHPSGIDRGASLLGALRPMHRFGGAFTETQILLCDLQTREAFFFDPARGKENVTRDFLLHPVHVCILAYPLLLHLTEHADRIWKLPNMVRLSVDAVCAQPGVLIDATGEPVRGRLEWSRRGGIAARLRNREVPPGGDPEAGQDDITEQERTEARQGAKPKW